LPDSTLRTPRSPRELGERTGEVPNPGNDSDFILTLNYQATYDSVTGTDIQIARTPA